MWYAAANACGIVFRTDDDEIVIHHVPAHRAKTGRHELVLERPRMHEQHVGVAVLAELQCSAGADRDYAVAFAIPVNTPGLKMICSPYGAPRTGHHDHPITSQHKMTETLTIFDDVFVPRERVFLQKEWQFAGDLAGPKESQWRQQDGCAGQHGAEPKIPV